MNGLNSLNSWADNRAFFAPRSAQGYANSERQFFSSSACGTGDSQPKPSSCGAGDSSPKPSACGASDEPKPKPSACGVGDEPTPKPSACGAGGK